MTAPPSAPKPVASPAQSAADRFTTCLAFTWQTDNDGQSYHVTPGDHGGPTAWGVTLAAFQAWRVGQHKPAPTAADLRTTSKSELSTLIRANYWNSVQADHLPLGVDLLVYDFGFGSGPGTSVTQLQRVLVGMGCSLVLDGQLGPMTLAAAAKVNRHDLAGHLGERHAAFYQSLQQFNLFGRGWLRRNTERVKLALLA